MAEFEAFDDSGGEGYDVFERASEFDTGDIVVGVKAQGRSGELALDGEGELGVVRRGDECGGGAGRDLLGEGWAGEHDAGVFGDGGDDLRHAQEGGLFDAFAGAQDDLVAREEGRDVGDDSAEVLRAPMSDVKNAT